MLRILVFLVIAAIVFAMQHTQFGLHLLRYLQQAAEAITRSFNP